MQSPNTNSITQSTITNTTAIPKHHHNKIQRRTTTNTATPAPQQPRSHGSTTQACAACKYQRRKCASDCILAPYFPHDRQPQFLNAHRLFGVSNIVKIVANLKQPEKDHAMRTIVFQSDARAADPVGGCYRIIRDLEQRINLAKAELEIVLHHLALCRAAAQQQMAGPQPQDGGGGPYDGGVGVEDLNSWACMAAGDGGNAHAESTSSSFPNHDDRDRHHHHHVIRPILDHLVCDDVTDEEFEFDSHGNIIPRNSSISTEEKATIKEEDDCFSYVQDQHDIKVAENFFSLTNCDL